MHAAGTISEMLGYLVQSTGRTEAQILAEAIEVGISALYRREVGDAYLAGHLSRDDALARLGESGDVVLEEADRARRAVEDDVRWGLQQGEAPVVGG